MAMTQGASVALVAGLMVFGGSLLQGCGKGDDANGGTRAAPTASNAIEGMKDTPTESNDKLVESETEQESECTAGKMVDSAYKLDETSGLARAAALLTGGVWQAQSVRLCLDKNFESHKQAHYKWIGKDRSEFPIEYCNQTISPETKLAELDLDWDEKEGSHIHFTRLRCLSDGSIWPEYDRLLLFSKDDLKTCSNHGKSTVKYDDSGAIPNTVPCTPEKWENMVGPSDAHTSKTSSASETSVIQVRPHMTETPDDLSVGDARVFHSSLETLSRRRQAEHSFLKVRD